MRIANEKQTNKCALLAAADNPDRLSEAFHEPAAGVLARRAEGAPELQAHPRRSRPHARQQYACPAIAYSSSFSTVHALLCVALRCCVAALIRAAARHNVLCSALELVFNVYSDLVSSASASRSVVSSIRCFLLVLVLLLWLMLCYWCMQTSCASRPRRSCTTARAGCTRRPLLHSFALLTFTYGDVFS